MRARSHSKSIDPLPFPVYFLTVTALLAVGLADSIYLAIAHYRVYSDIGYKSFCAISRAINCDTVAQSPYAVFAGVPVAVWGIVGYLVFLALALIARQGRETRGRGWATLTLLAALFSIISIWLGYISAVHIESYCIMCLLSYAVNLLLLFTAWLVRRRFERISWRQSLVEDMRHYARNGYLSGIALFGFTGVILTSMAAYPAYWEMEPTALQTDLPHGITADGHPWIGAVEPELVIVEFADYQCFQCKKMHYFLRELAAEHPEEIRIVHRHFPMDRKFNPLVNEAYHDGSGKLALLAIYAATVDRFWEFNDLLYQKVHQNEFLTTPELAEKIGLDSQQMTLSMADPRIRLQLRIDILRGIKLGLRGTPGFVIDGQVYQGHIPPEVLKSYLE